jgi:hypothetical protein
MQYSSITLGHYRLDLLGLDQFSGFGSALGIFYTLDDVVDGNSLSTVFQSVLSP